MNYEAISIFEEGSTNPASIRSRFQILLDAHAPCTVDHLTLTAVADHGGDSPQSWFQAMLILSHNGPKLSVCPRCAGSGEVYARDPEERPDEVTPRKPCERCHGDGTILAVT